jgi:Cd2+/Zn2+-exporting ATPase
MQDDLSKLPYLVRLSKKALGIVRRNIWASILIKGAFAILTFPGLITLWLAVAVGDMGLSLAIILNAMRLYSLNASSDGTPVLGPTT